MANQRYTFYRYMKAKNKIKKAPFGAFIMLSLLFFFRFLRFYRILLYQESVEYVVISIDKNSKKLTRYAAVEVDYTIVSSDFIKRSNSGRCESTIYYKPLILFVITPIFLISHIAYGYLTFDRFHGVAFFLL